MAKVKSLKGICDFRPVALTSLIMKEFEKLTKRELIGAVEDSLDPLQFEYRNKRGDDDDDAVVALLNMIFKHLEGPGTHTQLLLISLLPLTILYFT